MNWKKVLTYTVAASLAGSLGNYATEIQAGRDFAFNFKNIGVPAIATALPTLLALFSRRPQDSVK